ncbi:hypothetical protein Kpol_1061p7 [Vanderwaltozyma polyspora DSM 70294]|uniref:IMS import disulfide relay-system CHCH-CHCH-like Cx9C domain-containing protein n=1 Tax=Vanderwaltozyma polyspora (strain ATCC 22028 / DSM 70294 / BCRC 21397 / CBS 2163 / NBRC 10782 / NRRL Y-8283 / UCD 57-17) TaxID=436907 RepID=A7TJD5_VANPO|nr:uncharacterized protein Kpol_1061p7 [Vanderwaltozyma polyspora DSM 70294]EDO17585.1 hypothetical protein Kpol_1061p7 [Vanderwaltozyma polyspora DSM 70294]
MSGVLDEIIMEDVAANCPEQFINYHKCISQPNQEFSNCRTYQVQLSECIRTEVPSLQKIMKNCGDLMKNYETCIRANMESRTINEQCTPLLNQLRDCAFKQVEGNKLAINEMKIRSLENGSKESSK